jgi:type IV fimbrial biogenesis protein FimT
MHACRALPVADDARGFTLIELLIAIAVLAVLAALALPSLEGFLQRHALRGAAQTLVLHLNLARAAAVNGRHPVVLCPANAVDAATAGCADSTRWDMGWIVFADADNDRRRDPGEALLQVGRLPDGVTAQSGQRRSLRFITDGSARGSTASVWVCHEQAPTLGRRVVLSNWGRVRSEANASRCG